jgi:hypothetical protein
MRMANPVRNNISLASIEYTCHAALLLVSVQKRDTVPESLNFINFSAVNVFMYMITWISPQKG